MKVSDVLSHAYQLLTDHHTLELEFQGCYATDLLSAAIKSALPQNALITIISHVNTVALAMMIDLPVIIISEARMVTPMMIDQANQEHIAILSTQLHTHEVIIDLYQRGLI